MSHAVELADHWAIVSSFILLFLFFCFVRLFYSRKYFYFGGDGNDDEDDDDDGLFWEYTKIYCVSGATAGV